MTNIDPTGKDCVYLSDDETAIEAVDADIDNSSTECGATGGTHVDGHFYGYGSTDPSGAINEYYSYAYGTQTDISASVYGGSQVPLSGTVDSNDVGIMTQGQIESMLVASNFIYSPLDTALSKVTHDHPGSNFRSGNSICSVHLNILPGTGVNGVPAKADFHVDEYSPLVTGAPFLDPAGAPMHLFNDVIPDIRMKSGRGDWTGNQNCQAYFAGGGE